MKKGTLYELEGLDGCGKDTQADLLVDNRGLIKTRLPVYHNTTGKILRQWIDDGKKGISEELFQSMMIANYIEHFQDFVIPELEKGNDVVVTRGIPSMLAYSGYFGANMQYIYKLAEAFELLVKDLDYKSILIDIPVEESLRRINKRDAETDQKKEDVFENNDVLSHVHSAYDHMTWDLRVDGVRTIGEIQEDILSTIDNEL